MPNTVAPRNKKLTGLIVIGVILIVSTLGHMRVLSDYDWYKYCLSYLPPGLIPVRYFISWAQRILGITVGWGLVAHRRWAVKLCIFLSIFDILTVYWRYPYQSFVNQCIVWDNLYGWKIAEAGAPNIHFSSYVTQAVILSCVLDVLFFFIVLYYLTRPFVKERLT